jgi:ATP-dependent exoDNAse (exonuclease V) beta subunit
MTGTHRIVWWDPASLKIDVDEAMGLRQRRLLEADESGKVSQEGVRAYEQWFADRNSLLDRGGIPLRRINTATDLARLAGRGRLAIAEAAQISIEEIARDAARPAGPRFGALVHAILLSIDRNPRNDSLASFAAMHARILGASVDEAAAAIEVVKKALGSPLMRRVASATEIRRESPVVIRLEDGSMVEGVADLAFKEADSWTVVDFKTDLEIARRLDEYRAQLGLYVRGIRASAGCPTTGVLLWL